MKEAFIFYKALCKVLLNFLPATISIIVGLAYISYKEKPSSGN